MIFTCLYTCIYRYSDFDEMFVRMVRRCPEGLFKKTMDISLSRMTLWEEKRFAPMMISRPTLSQKSIWNHFHDFRPFIISKTLLNVFNSQTWSWLAFFTEASIDSNVVVCYPFSLKNFETKFLKKYPQISNCLEKSFLRKTMIISRKFHVDPESLNP